MGGMTNILLAAALALGTSPAGNRAAIQGEIDAASAAGGGRVTIPAGTWATGSLELKSGVELHLEKGAVLKGSVDPKDYNADDAFPENFHSVGEEWSGGHLVWARAAKDIAITGEGVIDGNGGAFFPRECQYQWGGLGYKYGIKLFPTDREWFRPGPMVAIFLSKGIRIEGVTLANTPCWTCHIRCSDGVTVRNVTIDADRTIANSDGFSIDCTRNVTIEKCVIKTGDDGFAIRASCPRHAATNVCENIAVRDCEVWSCCFGARLGIGTGTIRNVRFENCNFHESAWGIGFTPAWVSVGRNVYIEDAVFRKCFVGECERPVTTSMPNADAHVRGLLFEDCCFESYLPCGIWQTEKAPVTGVKFVRCDRRTVYEHKVLGRYFDQKRNRAEYRRKADLFLETNADVVQEAVTPVRGEAKGVLILSFDDRNFKGWRDAIPLFDKYGAHATFFVSGEIDNDVVRTMKLLRAHGHSIGLHGLRHADADTAVAKLGDFWKYYDEDIAKQKRTCDVCYVPVTSFAYPNCRRTEETDKGFYQAGYERVRGGVKDAAPFDPKGVKQKDRKPLVTNEAVYFPAADLPKHRLINTVIMGEAYHTDINEICDCLRRVAKNREVISITSHDIGPDAKFIHMKTEWLETMLKLAKELGIQVLGFDELPPPDDLR